LSGPQQANQHAFQVLALRLLSRGQTIINLLYSVKLLLQRATIITRLSVSHEYRTDHRVGLATHLLCLFDRRSLVAEPLATPGQDDQALTLLAHRRVALPVLS
jgi:hypothetical protein